MWFASLKVASHDDVSLGDRFRASAGKPFDPACLMIRYDDKWEGGYLLVFTGSDSGNTWTQSQ